MKLKVYSEGHRISLFFPLSSCLIIANVAIAIHNKNNQTNFKFDVKTRRLITRSIKEFKKYKKLKKLVLLSVDAADGTKVSISV